VQDCPWKKNPKAQRVGGVAQVVEHLPNNYEGLSSNTSNSKEDEGKEEEREGEGGGGREG
jgi:hypothetical protein